MFGARVLVSRASRLGGSVTRQSMRAAARASSTTVASVSSATPGRTSRLGEEDKTMNVIGYGAVGQAWYRTMRKIISKDMLKGIKKIRYWAPEIKEFKEDGIFEFNPSTFFDRANLIANLDAMKLVPGDIVIELATRIDTKTIWSEVKKRGCHFLNSGFDVWPDIELDLDLIGQMQRDPQFSKGTGLTSVFSFGCNPGIASHFVRHGLTAATGIEDAREAAKVFGLRAVSFNERDTQWPVEGSEGEKKLISTQLDVLYNTWSPGNYIVETAESTILYAGCPEEAKEINSAGPAVVAWLPSGPNIGFLAPHDETFTIQDWFDKEIPAVFVYEAPPTARAYIKGGRRQHSSAAVCKLLTPGAYDVAAPGYDMLGALLFSDKPGQAPFWCGIAMNVADAKELDPAGDVGPTPFQVTGGLWSALQYVLQHPNGGDCFPEDVPTPFVMGHAFPWAGQLIAREAPEALEVPALFDPGAPEAMTRIYSGEPAEGRIASTEAGTTASAAIPISTAVHQLAFEPWSIVEVVKTSAVKFAHSCAPNAYVDRNRMVRTSRDVPAGEAITLDYSLLAFKADDAAPIEGACACGAAGCRGTIGAARSLDKAYLSKVVKEQAILGDEALKSYTA